MCVFKCECEKALIVRAFLFLVLVSKSYDGVGLTFVLMLNE